MTTLSKQGMQPLGRWPWSPRPAAPTTDPSSPSSSPTPQTPPNPQPPPPRQPPVGPPLFSRPVVADALPEFGVEQLFPQMGPWVMLGGFAVVGLLTGGLGFASVAQYRVTVKGLGLVRPQGELRLVQAGMEARVSSVAVRIGQTVAVGDAIATLETERYETQTLQLQDTIRQLRAQLTQLDAQMQSLQWRSQAESQTIQRQVAQAEAEQQLSQQTLSDQQTLAAAALAEIESEVALLREEARRYRALAEAGAVPMLESITKDAALEQAIARSRSAQVKLTPSTAPLEVARQKIAQIQSQGQGQLAQIHQEYQALLQQRYDLQNQIHTHQQTLNQLNHDSQSATLRAPVAGVIQSLSLRNPGQVVKAGEQIAEIAPTQEAPEIQVTVSPRDIAQIELGQTAQMRVSACPYPDFGTLPGTVERIAPDISRSVTGVASYTVTVRPQRLELRRGSVSCQIRPGSEGEVNIMTRQETILAFLMRQAKLTF